MSSSVQTQANYVYPPLEAGAGLASPEDGCSAIENPDDIEGTFCIVQRGGCLYQTKYDACIAAGAVAVVVVNNNGRFDDAQSPYNYMLFLKPLAMSAC